MSGKQQAEPGRKGKSNLGQLDASPEKEKDEDLRQMRELSKNAKQEQTDRKQ
jgi:hypothetical protein